MTANLYITDSGKRFKARVITAQGQLIGQAVDEQPEAASKRAIRQARRWGADRNWPELTIKRAA